MLIKPDLDKLFLKLARKDKKQLLAIWKKVDEVRSCPSHTYKNLRKPLHAFKRVHILDSFVLVFTVDHERELVELWWFAHHDIIYAWRPK